MKTDLISAVRIILEKCIVLKANERCLVLTDATAERKEIAELLYEDAKKTTSKAELLKIPEPTMNGEEPSTTLADKMKGFDVILIITAKSLSHTKARKNACEAGARIASMPGIKKDIMLRAIDVDYDKMKERTNKIADALDKAETVRVVTEIGTDITFSIKDRLAHGRKTGIYDQAGYWGNLPEGEAFIAPVEGTAKGVYVVDASQAGIGKLKKPITIRVKEGFAVEFEGGDEAIKLKQILERIHDKNAFNIAELGIGTNIRAVVTGVTLEDEKVFGTCHFALGNNAGFGGNINVPVHLDGVLNKPTIYLDEIIIMEKGELLI